MNPKTWKEMVDNTRILEKAMGGKTKKIEDNEKESSIVQRRSIRASVDIKKGEKNYKKNALLLETLPKKCFETLRRKKNFK